MKDGKIQSFTDLKTWQQSHQLLLLIYTFTKQYPKEELFCLVMQMRRAALSITSNIAEGFGMRSYKEKIQFYYLAQGSLVELKNQIIASKDIGYLNDNSYGKIMEQANVAHQLLQGLITKSKTILNS